MARINVLNIPNYYSSYYLLGLNTIAELKFAPRNEFKHLDYRPFLAIEYQGKIAVIENDDPIGVDEKSYGLCDLYFATNKLLANEDYNWPKVRPLYPHYPIDNSFQFLKLFGTKQLFSADLVKFLKQWYILYRRPEFIDLPYQKLEGNEVFFAGSIWKKEPLANQIRADFIQACKHSPLIKFEGGMTPRTDVDLCVLSPEVMGMRYTPKEFAHKSSRSVLGLNNPAVRDAVSWRLAEYWNYSCFVLGFPFKIDLPSLQVHGKHLHYIHDSREFPEVIDFVMKNHAYREKVSHGGKEFFRDYCLPESQAQHILNTIDSG